MKKLLLSFKYAAVGILFCIKSCRNFRVHTVAALLALCLSGYCRNAARSRLTVVLFIALVMTAEALNCALEQLCNAYTEDYSTAVKHAKDAAAGAVLIAALCAAAGGIYLFISESAFIRAYADISSSPVKIAAIAVYAVAAVIFIFYGDIFKHESK